MLGWKEAGERWIDPTVAFRTEFAGKLRPGLDVDRAWWMAILDLRGITMTELLEQAGGGLSLPFFYDETARAQRSEGQHVAAYVQRSFLVRANRPDGDLAKVVPRMVLGGLVSGPPPAGVAPSVAGQHIEVPAGSTVVAVIDNGIAFAHELFRTSPTESRVHFAWIMDGTPSGPGHQGRLLEKVDIDALLAGNTHSGLLDEDAFYRQAGLIDFGQPGIKPAAFRLSHGTHVMGLAAGMTPADADETLPIVCVQLPTDLTMDVTGSHLEVALGHALGFILACARRFRIRGTNRVPPVAINFSFGNFAGPHDGTGVIEQMIDQALSPGPPSPLEPLPEVRMTLPAGNGNLDRCHAEIRFRSGVAQATLDWRVLPDDRSMSHVEIWLPWRAGSVDDLVSVTVEPPGGPVSPPVGAAAGLPPVQLMQDGTQVGSLGFVRMAAPTDRGVVLVSIYPTASVDGGIDLAPPGLWKIRISRKILPLHEPVQVWIRRDDTLPGFPLFGRQSYFDNACYRRFDALGAPRAEDPPGDRCIVRRSGTLSGFACGDLPSVIGGYVASGKRALADYSSGGPIAAVPGTSNPNRIGPDAAAPSDDSPVLHGVLSAGSRCGSLVAMNGTSVAAPRVARWIAGALAAGGAGDRNAVWQKGAAGEGPAGRPSEFRAGGGRMSLPRLFGKPRL